MHIVYTDIQISILEGQCLLSLTLLGGNQSINFYALAMCMHCADILFPMNKGLLFNYVTHS